jgi:hypothetical protein
MTCCLLHHNIHIAIKYGLVYLKIFIILSVEVPTYGETDDSEDFEVCDRVLHLLYRFIWYQILADIL